MSSRSSAGGRAVRRARPSPGGYCRVGKRLRPRRCARRHGPGRRRAAACRRCRRRPRAPGRRRGPRARPARSRRGRRCWAGSRGLGVAVGHLGGVDEQAVGPALDVGEQAVVEVAGLDVARQPDGGARWQQLGQALRRLGAEALVGPVAGHALGGVDADEADVLFGAAHRRPRACRRRRPARRPPSPGEPGASPGEPIVNSARTAASAAPAATTRRRPPGRRGTAAAWRGRCGWSSGRRGRRARRDGHDRPPERRR